VRGCSRTGGPGCSSLPVGSNVWVLSVRLLCCTLAHARGFVRRSELRWAPNTQGTGLGGTAGQHTLTASAPPLVPTLDAAFTTVSTALSVLWRRTKTGGAEDNVSTLARKQRGNPTTRANTPAPVILRPCGAGLAGSFTASTCFRHTRCGYSDIWFTGRASHNAEGRTLSCEANMLALKAGIGGGLGEPSVLRTSKICVATERQTAVRHARTPARQMYADTRPHRCVCPQASLRVRTPCSQLFPPQSLYASSPSPVRAPLASLA
jgi:hypothetical protein